MKTLVPLEVIANKLRKYKYDRVVEVMYSKAKNKKYAVILDDGKRINFGDIRYEDYLTHKDDERRANFRKRNKRFLKFPKYSPARLSYNILW